MTKPEYSQHKREVSQGNAHLGAYIPNDLKTAFDALLKLQGRSKKEVLTELVKGYIEENKGAFDALLK